MRSAQSTVMRAAPSVRCPPAVAEVEPGGREDGTGELTDHLRMFTNAEGPERFAAGYSVDIDTCPGAEILPRDPTDGVHVEDAHRKVEPEVSVHSAVY